MPKFTNFTKLFKEIYNIEHNNNKKKIRYEIIEEFINKYKYERIAELGCGMGNVAIYLLANCPSIKEYIAIDPGPPHNNRNEKFEIKSFNKFNKGRFINKTALEAAKEFPDKYFDLVYMDELAHITDFIDQYPNSPPLNAERISKNNECIKRDIIVWDKKVRGGGLLCGHDYCNKNHIRVVRAVNEVIGGALELIPEKQNNIWLKKYRSL